MDEIAEGVELIDEIEDIAVGDTPHTLTVSLEAGSYVFICNIVQEQGQDTIVHYQQGMRTGFTVEERPRNWVTSTQRRLRRVVGRVNPVTRPYMPRELPASPATAASNGYSAAGLPHRHRLLAAWKGSVSANRRS